MDIKGTRIHKQTDLKPSMSEVLKQIKLTSLESKLKIIVILFILEIILFKQWACNRSHENSEIVRERLKLNHDFQ